MWSEIQKNSWALKVGPIGCIETSVRNYHYQPRNNPEERSSFSSLLQFRVMLVLTKCLCICVAADGDTPSIDTTHQQQQQQQQQHSLLQPFQTSVPLTLTDVMFYSTYATVYLDKCSTVLLWFLNCPLTRVFIWDFSGRRSHGRPLKRLLDVRDRTGSTLGPTAWLLHDDEDDDDDENVSTIFVHYRGRGGFLVFLLRVLIHSPKSHDITLCFNFSKWPTWRTILLFYNTFIKVLYMFRATSCSSSGGQIVLIQHLV